MKKVSVNSQNQLIRESIFTALMILMERKSFNKITITEIVNKAGVSRMSYYRNYCSKEDIINQYFDEVLEEYMEVISNYEKYDRYHRKYWFITCFKNNERLIKNLIQSELEFLVLERINIFADKVVEIPSSEKMHLPEAQKDIRSSKSNILM
jgi:AcrR family transcriptional regulator